MKDIYIEPHATGASRSSVWYIIQRNISNLVRFFQENNVYQVWSNFALSLHFVANTVAEIS